MSAPLPADRISGTEGGSLVELVVAIGILAISVLGTVQMGVVARQQSRAGALATDMWTVAQLQFEELKAEDFDSLATRSDTVRGFPVSWTVSGTEPKTVTLSVTRPTAAGGQVADTFVMWVADWGGP